MMDAMNANINVIKCAQIVKKDNVLNVKKDII